MILKTTTETLGRLGKELPEKCQEDIYTTTSKLRKSLPLPDRGTKLVIPIYK